MTLQTIKVENGTITLPPKLRKAWREAEVFVEASKDTISIKRLTRPSLTLGQMMNQFSQAARKTKLSKKKVARTIQEVRKELYQ